MKVVRQPLKRFYGRGELHFVTFSCLRRRPYLGTVRGHETSATRERGLIASDALGERTNPRQDPHP